MPTHRLLANGRAPCLALLQTAERLWRVSLVDSWCLTNLSNRTPSPLENEPRRTSSRKPYLRTKLQHLRGRFNWVAVMGSPTQKQAKAAQFQGMRRIGGVAADVAALQNPMLRASGARVPNSSAVPSKPRRWRDRAAARE